MFGWKKTLGSEFYRNYAGPSAAWDGAGINSASRGAMTNGLVCGSMVATKAGWRPIETIVSGDLVLTFDGGLQPVKSVARGVLWSGTEICPEWLWPINVPAGALGNTNPMVLLAEQPVMLESDLAEEMFGDPFVMVAPDELEGKLGIETVPPEIRQDVIALTFEEEEVIFVDGGALLYCPHDLAVGTTPLEQIDDLVHADTIYNVLPSEEARLIVADLVDSAAGGMPTAPNDPYAA